MFGIGLHPRAAIRGLPQPGMPDAAAVGLVVHTAGRPHAEVTGTPELSPVAIPEAGVLVTVTAAPGSTVTGDTA